MRAFFCLPLSADVRAGIARAAERIRREARVSASWVEPDNYHITLRFLGDIDPSSTVRLKGLATEVAGECGAFSIALREIGAFPSLDRARVLWVGGKAPDGFRALAESAHRQAFEPCDRRMSHHGLRLVRESEVGKALVE